MSFSYDIATPVGQVRFLLQDTNNANPGPLFQDGELAYLLSKEQNVVEYAAADAYEVLAGSETLTQKRIVLLDLKTDGPAESKELRAVADALRKQYDRLGAWDWAEMVEDHFTSRERLLNQILRQQLFPLPTP